MPVRKLRTLAEAEEAVWMDPNDPRLWETICAVWALADELCPRTFEPGLRKFRSIEALNAARDEAEREFIRARTAADGGGPPGRG